MECLEEFTLERTGRMEKVLGYVKDMKGILVILIQPKLFIKSSFQRYVHKSQSFVDLSSLFIDSELHIKAMTLLNPFVKHLCINVPMIQ